MNDVEKANLIKCTGMDNIIHTCVSWKNECLCGMKVLKKTYETPHQECHCWQCESICYQETGDENP